MLTYIIKRILLFVPTLFIIILLTFILSKLAPGDPVENMLGGISEGGGQLAERQSTERLILETRKKLGLDLPVFYFALSSAAVPDTLYRVEKKYHRNTLSRLIDTYGNWNYIADYYRKLKQLELNSYLLKSQEEYYDAAKAINEETDELLLAYKEEDIYRHLDVIEEEVKNIKLHPELHKSFEDVKASFLQLTQNPAFYKNYIPTLHFYGFKTFV